MTDVITEARELLETHEPVTASDYKRIIKALIDEVYQAYEDGCNLQSAPEGFSESELITARRLG